jgi:hypothetical protein
LFPLNESSGLRGGKVLDARDVKQGTLNESFGNGVAVQIDSDKNGIPFDEHYVVIGDVVGLSIGHANPERLERLNVHAFFELQCGYHGLSLFLSGSCFKRDMSHFSL